MFRAAPSDLGAAYDLTLALENISSLDFLGFGLSYGALKWSR